MGAGDYEAVVEAARLLLAAFQFFDEKRHVIGIAVHREAALTDPPFNSVQVMAAFALSAFLITLQRVWFEASVLGGTTIPSAISGARWAPRRAVS